MEFSFEFYEFHEVVFFLDFVVYEVQDFFEGDNIGVDIVFYVKETEEFEDEFMGIFPRVFFDKVIDYVVGLFIIDFIENLGQMKGITIVTDNGSIW